MILVIQSEEANRLRHRLRDGLSILILSVVMAICRDVKGLTDVQMLRFRRGEPVLLNERPECRWMTISGR